MLKFNNIILLSSWHSLTYRFTTAAGHAFFSSYPNLHELKTKKWLSVFFHQDVNSMVKKQINVERWGIVMYVL